jgi:hypothetical protein
LNVLFPFYRPHDDPHYFRTVATERQAVIVHFTYILILLQTFRREAHYLLLLTIGLIRMRRTVQCLHARTFRRCVSTRSAPSSDLLWSSDSFHTRLSQLTSTAGDNAAFPSAFYPRLKRIETATTVGQFVGKYGRINASELEKYKSDVVTLSGMPLSYRPAVAANVCHRPDKVYKKTWLKTGVCAY